MLKGRQDEQTPLNGAVQLLPAPVEEPCPAQVRSLGTGAGGIRARSGLAPAVSGFPRLSGWAPWIRLARRRSAPQTHPSHPTEREESSLRLRSSERESPE